MKFKISNRQFLSAAIILFYLVPLLFFSAYSAKLLSLNKSWSLLSLGLLLAVFGTLTLIFLLSCWEESMREKKSIPSLLVSQPSLALLAGEKETKVTSIDPSLMFSHHSLEDIDATLKENGKEFNLLQAALKANQEQQEQLVRALEVKEKEGIKLGEENQRLHLQVQQMTQDFADYKLFSEEQLKQRQLQLVALQQTIEDQRAEMEKRQEQIHHLDSKVHDLSYEIKTLLDLHHEIGIHAQPTLHPKEEAKRLPLRGTEVENNPPMSADRIKIPAHQEGDLSENAIRTPLEAAKLLKKCMMTAQRLTGSSYYSNESSRYREFSSSYFAIDQRRLFDSLRSETRALLVVYSQKEQKLLFANHASQMLLGWSPEKFVSDFPSLLQEGMHDWRKALQTLATTTESQTRVLAKTRQGHEVLLNCHLGVIASGLFRNYIIGVLYLC